MTPSLLSWAIILPTPAHFEKDRLAVLSELGGLDTTKKWLANVIVVLHRHPHVLEEIRADRRLAPQAIEGAMRLETVAQVLLRLVRIDGTEFAGQTLGRNGGQGRPPYC